MDTIQEKTILDGKIKLTTKLTEFRMSLWVNGFGLVNTKTGEEIIPLISFFNLDEIVEVEETLKIKFRIYPDGYKDYNVNISPLMKSFIYKNKEYHTDNSYETITGEKYE